MFMEDNKAKTRRAYEEIWNQGKLAVIDELFAPTFLYHDPGLPQVRTLEDFKRLVAEVRNAYTDFHITLEDVIAEGEQVAMRYQMRGIHTKDCVWPLQIPATGKQFTVTGIGIVRLVEGKAVEFWNEPDNLGLLQQLGLIPVPQPVG